MGRELQKRKNRSSRPRVRQKPKSKKLNIKSNPIVAAKWNQSLTLSQNYRNLGLSAKLNSSTGGLEPALSSSNPSARKSAHHGPLAISGNTAPKKGLEITRVIRDDEGNIVSVVRSKEEERRARNPLGDPLNDLSDENEYGDDGSDGSEDEEGERGFVREKGIVPQLEEASKAVKRKRPRKQSERERDWIKSLVDRWGDDLEAMAKDSRLNPMQQSKGDLKRRMLEYQKHIKSAEA